MCVKGIQCPKGPALSRFSQRSCEKTSLVIIKSGGLKMKHMKQLIALLLALVLCLGLLAG